jgi:hypothetical protein
MKTDNLKYIRHLYKLLPTKHKSYKLYNLAEVTKGSKILTDLIRIENDRQFHNGKGFKTWLRIKDAETWKDSTLVTGLRPTNKVNVFEGNKCTFVENQIKKESLILIQYSKDFTKVVIDFFPYFYPYNPFVFRELLKSHKYYYKEKTSLKTA